jgi:transcriptional regulator with XRE-family HTH domain
MKLTQKALDLIKSDAVQRLDIAKALGVSDQTLMRYIKDNNDELTKAAALVQIRKITGMKDSEILEKTKVVNV